MKAFHSVVLVGSLLLGTGAVANAQRGWDRDHRASWQDHDHDNDRNWNDRKAYQDGFKDGQKDARKRDRKHYNNRYRDNDDRRAYDYGYRRGYGDSNGGYYPNNYPNDGHSSHPFGDVMARNNYPNNGSNGLGMANQNGYSDGLAAGQKDKSTGHSFRPTENKGYQDADRGYSISGVSNKDQYKQAYRNGFTRGYQRGYYGR
jgi:hypothetical protein